MTTSRSSAKFAPGSGIGAGLALALAGEGAPAWVQLMPAGPRVAGRDGRAWLMADAAAVIAASKTPFAIDYEHAMDLRAVNGEEAPAAGWVEALEPRDGQVWARVDWTPKATAAIAAREYRFLSPAFLHDAEGRVQRLVGGGLVNRPNFEMAALNQEGSPMFNAIAAALGLTESATEAEIVAAATKLRTTTALNAETLRSYVPRADYDLALNRAVTAETAVRDHAAAGFKAEVETAIGEAIKAGKVAPASKDYHLAVCATKEGFAEFKKFVAIAPSAFGSVELDKSAGDGALALNAEAEATARALGLNTPELLKAFADGIAKGAGKH